MAMTRLSKRVPKLLITVLIILWMMINTLIVQKMLIMVLVMLQMMINTLRVPNY
jgi:hypothetical protein